MRKSIKGFRLFPLAVALPLLVGQPSAAQVAATLPPPVPAEAPRHERVLPLQGGQNFRDLGGYRTIDGRNVRWGLLYRSGSMHFLTAADHAYLQRLGIRTVCDFRSTSERRAEPVAWPADAPPAILAEDYVQDTGLGATGRNAAPATAAEARARMTGIYPGLLVQFNGQYRRMFAELLAGRAPLAFNCSAGKDRTGVAAALLLTALGVPRETVIADYLLTNRYFDPGKVVGGANGAAQGFQTMPRDVVRPYMVADRAYIEAAFRVVDGHAGGANGYLKDELGLTAIDIARLRRMYTS